MSKRSAGQGGVCGGVFHLLQPSGEFVLRQDSPRPSGTPLINAGGKGIVLIHGAFFRFPIAEWGKMGYNVSKFKRYAHLGWR